MKDSPQAFYGVALKNYIGEGKYLDGLRCPSRQDQRSSIVCYLPRDGE